MNLVGALVVLAVLLTATVLLGAFLQWRQNRPQRHISHEVVQPERLGADGLGELATLLQFSTELCARCPGVHRTLAAVADEHPGVLPSRRRSHPPARHRQALPRPADPDDADPRQGRRRPDPVRRRAEPRGPRARTGPTHRRERRCLTPSRPATGIDPRGPRFAAGITALLLLIDLFLALTGLAAAQTPDGTWAIAESSIAERIADPAFLLLLLTALLFLWGVLSPRTAPWGVLYRRVVQPRLSPPTELEDPRPPRFAQGVGLFVVGIGLVLHLARRASGLPIAAGLAFVAAFLNAVFGLCLGLPDVPPAAARRPGRPRTRRRRLSIARPSGIRRSVVSDRRLG